jgi:hypothetical protein
MNAEEWIVREDSVAQQDRVSRLQWLLHQTPENEIWLFHGGLLSHELFEQTRYCFVYGQYLATIILGLSFIEHTLAALFFASGRNDLERANISVLIERAFEEGWIDQEELKALDQARKIRNDVTHFRKPGNDSSLEKQTFGDPEEAQILFGNNARQIMLIVFRILNRFSVR